MSWLDSFEADSQLPASTATSQKPLLPLKPLVFSNPNQHILSKKPQIPKTRSVLATNRPPPLLQPSQHVLSTPKTISLTPRPPEPLHFQKSTPFPSQSVAPQVQKLVSKHAETLAKNSSKVPKLAIPVEIPTKKIKQELNILKENKSEELKRCLPKPLLLHPISIRSKMEVLNQTEIIDIASRDVDYWNNLIDCFPNVSELFSKMIEISETFFEIILPISKIAGKHPKICVSLCKKLHFPTADYFRLIKNSSEKINSIILKGLLNFGIFYFSFCDYACSSLSRFFSRVLLDIKDIQSFLIVDWFKLLKVLSNNSHLVSLVLLSAFEYFNQIVSMKISDENLLAIRACYSFFKDLDEKLRPELDKQFPKDVLCSLLKFCETNGWVL
ncbi:hypothetical protein RCL1_002370 [Eukaryota sp. TZLM3-RCL]